MRPAPGRRPIRRAATASSAAGETEASANIAYAMPDVLGRDRARYAGKIVAVIGSGHSAIGTLIDLVRLKREAPGTQAIWLLRGDNPNKAFGGGANDKLAARGELGAEFARLVADGEVRIETGFAVSRIDKAGEQTAHRHRLGLLRPRGRRPTNWSSPPASVPTSRSCANCDWRSIRRWNARRPWRR